MVEQKNSFKIRLFVRSLHPFKAMVLWKAHYKAEMISWYMIILWVPNTLHRHIAKLYTQDLNIITLLQLEIHNFIAMAVRLNAD